MRGVLAKRPVEQLRSWPIAAMLWLILLIIIAMWAVPFYIGQPLAAL